MLFRSILAATRGRRPMFGAAARKDKAMIDIRKFDSLGHADHGWLDARHHFSFAGYHDPDRVGWGALRVWNDDAIAAQPGFPPPPHPDMEFIPFFLPRPLSPPAPMRNTGTT